MKALLLYKFLFFNFFISQFFSFSFTNFLIEKACHYLFLNYAAVNLCNFIILLELYYEIIKIYTKYLTLV